MDSTLGIVLLLTNSMSKGTKSLDEESEKKALIGTALETAYSTEGRNEHVVLKSIPSPSHQDSAMH